MIGCSKLGLLLVAVLISCSGSVSALTGNVVDSAGNGIVGAKVILTAAELVEVTFTGSNGTFVLSDLPPNSVFQIKVLSAGYSAVQLSANSDAVEPISFSLPYTQATIRGVVIYPDGVPIAEVNVSAGSFGAQVTDEDGRFEFTLPIHSEYSISATAPDTFFATSVSGTLVGDTVRTLVGVDD